MSVTWVIRLKLIVLPTEQTVALLQVRIVVLERGSMN